MNNSTLCENNKGTAKLSFDVESKELARSVRLHAWTAVVEPTPELMKGLDKLFVLEADI